MTEDNALYETVPYEEVRAGLMADPDFARGVARYAAALEREWQEEIRNQTGL